jgi:tight adherence protein B
VAVVIAALLMAAAVWCGLPSWSSLRVDELAGRRRQTAAAILGRTRKRMRLGFGSAARRRSARARARTVQALGALAAELEAGQPPTLALIAAGGDPSIWPNAVATIPLGDDIGSALRRDAIERPVLGQLAACWQVSAITGTGFAASVGRLAASARAAETVRVSLEGELAGPRATARMLAALPLVGVGFGMLLGSDPLSWLLTTFPGTICLVAGLTLTVLGTVWTGRIAASVERRL